MPKPVKLMSNQKRGISGRRKNCRTPSGNLLQGKVGKISTIFAPKRSAGDCISIVSNEVHEPLKLSADASRFNRQESKHAKCEHDNANRVKTHKHDERKRRCPKLLIEEVQSETELDSEGYFTPPSTPHGVLRKFPSFDNNPESSKSMADLKQAEVQEAPSQSSESLEDSSQNSTKVIQITAELEQMMESHDENTLGAQLIDIKIVHSMFKRMEESFNQKLERIKQDCEEMLKQDQRDENSNSDKEDDIDQIRRAMRATQLKQRASKSAIHSICESNKEMQERVVKLELNNYKKMILINGLSIHGKKFEKINQLENFFTIELGLNIPVEDFFEIGTSNPKSVVVILLSVRDRASIMRHKNLLKNVRNEDGKKIYINDYIPASENEMRKNNKAILHRVTQIQKEDKPTARMEGNTLMLNEEKFVPTITPPDPQKIIDLTTAQLEEIMEIKVLKGSEVIEEGNVFLAFTYGIH